ncbi:MAG: YciI family protein [Candidatus Dormibacteraeota bacterium]|nr:YciI family protein [Candidatus Dormibacteraeota bacterium]
MKYMLLICVDSAIEPFKTDPTIEQWLDEVGRRRLDGSELRSPRDATTVRTRGDELLLTDGPFAETREYVAGYDVVECADLDEAIQIASRHPCAKFGAVEVRPFVDE